MGALQGTLDGVTLAVREVDRESPRPSLEVVASGGLPPSLVLTLWTEGMVRDGALRTGDKGFDRAILVRGEPGSVMAALDAATRATLVDYAAAREVAVDQGTLTMKVLGGAQDLARLVDTPRQAAALVRSLSVAPDAIVPRLARSAIHDPAPRTRRTCLDLLIARHLDAPETQEALAAALSDRSAHVRLAAALESGAEGTPILEALLAEPDLPYQLRDAAAFQLSKTVPASRVKSLLDPYLIDGHPMRKQAVEQMIARGADPGLSPLMTMLRSQDVDEICVGARCVGAHGYKQAEVTLVQLVHHADKKVQVGVVHALGQVGTKRALGVLKKISVDPSVGARLKRSATEAVRRIEARTTVAG